MRIGNAIFVATFVAGFAVTEAAMPDDPDAVRPVRERAAVRAYGRRNESEKIQLLRKRAKRGDAEAQNKLGEEYRRGKLVALNETKAVEWFRRAAEQGYAEAQCNLGFMYHGGGGAPRDYAEAAKWYRRAAEQGNAWAQYEFGRMCGRGQGVPQDKTEAAKWYRRAAEQGFHRAQHPLALAYAKGDGVPQSYAEAAKWFRINAESESVLWFRSAAERGNPEACYDLCGMYDDRYQWGIPRNNAEAVEFLRRAAEGSAAANFNLGRIYDEGWGVPRDEAEAAKWYRRAAERGHAEAQFQLGQKFHNGEGVPQDDAEAVKWFRHAAEQGHFGAKCELGVAPGMGRGEITKHAEAQFALGEMHANGGGAQRENKRAAAKYYRLAAEQGHAQAQLNLGLAYAKGEGVQQDWLEAVKWVRLATEQMHSQICSEAQSALDRVADQIQVADGKEGESALMECAGVYVVSRPDDGLVKVGKTGDFRGRFTQIRSDCFSAGHPNVVPVVLFPVNENRGAVEERAHAKLREYRTAGEWFNCDADTAIRAVLDSLPQT